MTTTWRHTRLRPEMLRCDLCGNQADTIHFVPWVTRCEEVLFACSEHDAGGYWFEVTRWFAEGDFAAHIAQKHGGEDALSKLLDKINEAMLVPA